MEVAVERDEEKPQKAKPQDSKKKQNSNENKVETHGEKNISAQTRSTISCFSSCCGSVQKVKN